jgi:TP901 family phage tail tape measure protein
VGSTVEALTRRQRELNNVVQQQERLGSAGSALRVQYAQQELALVERQIVARRRLQSALQANHNAVVANREARAGYRSKIGETIGLAVGAGAPIVAAAQFEKAMLGVAKQVDGARNDAGQLTTVYFDMAKQIQQLGRTIPIATNDLADMVTAGARMGIAKNELIEFTQTAAMMASAFELPAAELADNMGKIRTLFGLKTQAEVRALADSINYLDDNAISKGGDIIEFMQRVGGVAGAVKITGTQMAALGSTLLTLGERTESASTATNAIFQKFAAAEKGTKKFKAAMKEIGLSTAKVQKGMQIDAQGTILEVLEKVRKLPKEKQLGVMVELVGLEHSDTLAKLAGGIEEYRKQIALAGNEKAKGSMSREFQAQLATTTAQWTILKNRVVEVAVNLGSVLLPTVNRVIGVIGSVTTGLAEWGRAHPRITQAVVGTVVALTSLKVAAWAAGYAFTFVKGGALAAAGAYHRAAAGVALYRSGMLGATATTALGASSMGRALLSVVPSITALAAAIMATPIGWIVAGVAAIAAGGVMIYKYWEPLKAFFVGFGQGFVAALAPVGQAISEAFAPIWNVVKPVVMPVLETIGGWVKSAIGWFGELLTPISATSDTTKAFGEAGKVCGEAIAAAFTFMLKPIQLVVDAIGWVNNNIGGVIDKAAKVGSAIAGGWQATKDFVTGGPAGAPTIPPMRGAAAGTGAAPVQQTNTFHITQQPGENAEQLARRVAEIQKRQQGVQKRGALTDGAQ